MTSGGESSFARAVTEMCKATKQVHSMAEEIASRAVRLTLRHVTTEFPLDYSNLLEKCETSVVTECCGMFELPAVEDGQGLCSWKTKAGKPCSNQAQLHGVCSRHLAQWKKQVFARPEVPAPARPRDPARVADPHAQELKDMSRKRTVNMTFPDGAAPLPWRS